MKSVQEIIPGVVEDIRKRALRDLALRRITEKESKEIIKKATELKTIAGSDDS